MDKKNIYAVGALFASALFILLVFSITNNNMDKKDTNKPTSIASNTSTTTPTQQVLGAQSEEQVTELKIEDQVVGTGNEVKKGDTVVIHYSGTLLNGTKFDSSYDRNQPFEVKIGVGYVIKGWDEGVVGMKVGGKRKLTIPYNMAYGEQGRPPVIPAKSPLVFELELLQIK